MVFIAAQKPALGWGKMNIFTFVKPKDNKESLEAILFVVLYLFGKRRLCR
jgi:hypothetical protein